MSATEQEPRRRPIRVSEIALALAEKQRPPDHPEAEIEQKVPSADMAKMGVLAVFQWRIHIPVCDEFPTWEEATAAAEAKADDWRMKYAPIMRSDLP